MPGHQLFYLGGIIMTIIIIVVIIIIIVVTVMRNSLITIAPAPLHTHHSSDTRALVLQLPGRSHYKF